MRDEEVGRRLKRAEEMSRELTNELVELRRAADATDDVLAQSRTTRERVLELLKDGQPRSPYELCKLLGRSHQTLGHLLPRMAKAGEVTKVSWGKYVLPGTDEGNSE